mmetsp:Transcript_21200/g.41138  ORF Transcript_21200/g.41138 Transcript_21200/m.41138 type:complete len:288 (-) Transcript_21200:102-965(-)
MTGLAAALHARIIRFCCTNTWVASISIPRSPRATMMPSLASRMSSKLSIPSWFSIFEMIIVSSGISFRISLTSSALRINDAKMISTFWETPNLMSSLSFSESAGRVTFAPGRFTPFRFEIIPPFFTTQWTSVSSIFSTSNAIKPSSINIVIPGLTVLGRSSYVTQNFSAVPELASFSSTVTMVLLPFFNSYSSEPSSFSVNVPVRISGPFVSSARAIILPTLEAASRTLSMSFFWYSCDPCEKLKRATSSPASISFSIIFTSCEPGPKVQTIPDDLHLVFVSPFSSG